MLGVILIFIVAVIFVCLTNNKKNDDTLPFNGGDAGSGEREKLSRGQDALKYLEKYNEEIRDELKKIATTS